MASAEEPLLFPIAEFQASKNLESSFSAGAGKAPDNNRVYDNKLAQSFTTSQTGRIVSVEVAVRPIRTEDPAPLRVSIHEMKDGLPGKELAAAEIPFEDIPAGEELRVLTLANAFTATARFEKGPLLWGGRRYCIVYSSSRTPANYHISGTRQEGATYPYGHFYKDNRKGGFESGDGDLFFRVAASPVNFLPLLIICGSLALAAAAVAGYLCGKASERSRRMQATPRSASAWYVLGKVEGAAREATEHLPDY